MINYYPKSKLFDMLVFLSIFILCLIFFIGHTGMVQATDGAGIECSKETAKTVVHSIAVGLGEMLKGVKIEKERIDIIRKFIDPIRFYTDGSGYFYVYDSNCVNIAHATQKELQGKNLRDYKDGKGKFVIRELSAAAKNGGGFVEYYWVKPGSGAEVRKLGYVEPIPGTDYFIGTGVYLP